MRSSNFYLVYIGKEGQLSFDGYLHIKEYRNETADKLAKEALKSSKINVEELLGKD